MRTEKHLEQKRNCPFCNRIFYRSGKGIQENKFCSNCHEERLTLVNGKKIHNSNVFINVLNNGYSEIIFS